VVVGLSHLPRRTSERGQKKAPSGGGTGGGEIRVCVQPPRGAWVTSSTTTTARTRPERERVVPEEIMNGAMTIARTHACQGRPGASLKEHACVALPRISAQSRAG
jgi:hypothetical protein